MSKNGEYVARRKQFLFDEYTIISIDFRDINGESDIKIDVRSHPDYKDGEKMKEKLYVTEFNYDISGKTFVGVRFREVHLREEGNIDSGYLFLDQLPSIEEEFIGQRFGRTRQGIWYIGRYNTDFLPVTSGEPVEYNGFSHKLDINQERSMLEVISEEISTGKKVILTSGVTLDNSWWVNEMSKQGREWRNLLPDKYRNFPLKVQIVGSETN